jgi:hypothetical protein
VERAHAATVSRIAPVKRVELKGIETDAKSTRDGSNLAGSSEPSELVPAGPSRAPGAPQPVATSDDDRKPFPSDADTLRAELSMAIGALDVADLARLLAALRGSGCR